MISEAAANRQDFSTDARPTLFMDNWGTDVVDRYERKVKAPIDAALALAQLITSLESGEPVQPDQLDVSGLDHVAFFDGHTNDHDQFFFLKLETRYRRGSYAGDRVSVGLMTGTIATGDQLRGTYDDAWSTLHGKDIAGRADAWFEQDLRRLHNAITVLEENPTRVTERPDDWPGNPDPRAYHDWLGARHRRLRPVFIGASPLTDIADEPIRVVRIPFLE